MRLFKFHFIPLSVFCFLFFIFDLWSPLWGLPSPQGPVNDFASILTPATKQELEAIATQLEKETSIELAVVTTPSLEELPVEDYCVKLFGTWRIGKKSKDNGLLFVVAPNERKARIEVGYGLEGFLNDAQATRILRNHFIPYAQNQKFEAGILETTQVLYKIFAHGVVAQEDTLPAPRRHFTLLHLLFFLIFIYMAIRHPFLLLFLMSQGRSGGSYGGFGGGYRGGGGFGGFGGGSSGGGGGSASW